MKDFKKSLEFKTTKNVDEVICVEIIKSMKKLCAELEKNKNKDNENAKAPALPGFVSFLFHTPTPSKEKIQKRSSADSFNHPLLL